MKAARFIGISIAILFASAGATYAHHSIGMIEISQPKWLTGTIVRYEATDPHAMIELAEQGGQKRRWIVEGPRLGRLEQIYQVRGMTAGQIILKKGDAISVCGFPLRKEYSPEQMYVNWQPVEGRFIHGQMLVMPDSSMQSWGPYGKLDNCVRGGDNSQIWASFLDRDRLAHKQWCDGLTYVSVAAVAPKNLVEAISRSIKEPCK